jgi:hypothetical protein
MRERMKKGPIWILLAVVLVVAALYWIRPQPVLTGEEITVSQVKVRGEDVLEDMDQQALVDLLLEVQGSRILSEEQDSWSDDTLVIGGTAGGTPFVLVLGDYNVLSYGEKCYRVRGCSDLLVAINDLLPEGTKL